MCCYLIYFCSYFRKDGCRLDVAALAERVEELQPRKKVRKRSCRLTRASLEKHPAFPDFVSGSRSGEASSFYCLICEKDVSMASRGVGEFNRHFMTNDHWQKDVTYRVHRGMQVYNKLLEPLTLNDRQLEDHRSRPWFELGTGYPFPEDLIPKHSRIESRVPFMTLVSCVTELLRSGGDFQLLRRLWGHFCASLADRDPLYSIRWSKSETLVSILFSLSVVVPLLFLLCFFCVLVYSWLFLGYVGI